VNKGGEPTFDHVVRGMDFMKKHKVDFNTLTVVQRHNSYHPVEVYRFLRECGSGFIQFIPIVERVAQTPGPDGLALISPQNDNQASVSDWSVEPLQYGKFLCAIFDEWLRNDVGQTFVQCFDVALEAWCGMNPGLCVFSETCGAGMALEHNGDLYSCDHYVYPKNRLGNILESPLETLVNSPQQQKFGADKRDLLPELCRECEFRFACNGECPKHRFVRTPGGEEGLNYLCPGYKLFFSHVAPYMKFMVDELREQRAPANVMAWVADRDRVLGKLGRNDPCICGSGLKVKKCCGKS
jgi:uncharacterized protein